MSYILFLLKSAGIVVIMNWTPIVVILLFTIQYISAVDLTRNYGATGLEVVILSSARL